MLLVWKTFHFLIRYRLTSIHLSWETKWFSSDPSKYPFLYHKKIWPFQYTNLFSTKLKHQTTSIEFFQLFEHPSLNNPFSVISKGENWSSQDECQPVISWIWILSRILQLLVKGPWYVSIGMLLCFCLQCHLCC